MKSNLPKILHLYWDGSPMSYLQVLTVVSFHSKNPDWAISVYIPKSRSICITQYIPPYIGKDCFKLLKDLDYVNLRYVDINDYGIDPRLGDIQRSDILRYILLNSMGGLWSDFDVLWLKPVESIFEFCLGNEDYADSFVCFSEDVKGHHNIGILGALPGSILYEELIGKCEQIQRSTPIKQIKHQTFGVDLWNREYPTFSYIQHVLPKTIAIPYKVFYPYSIKNLQALYERVDLTCLENAVAVHWFNGHRITKRYLNSPNSENQVCSINKIVNLIKGNYENFNINRN